MYLLIKKTVTNQHMIGNLVKNKNSSNKNCHIFTTSNGHNHQRGEKTICPLFHFRVTCQLGLFLKYPQQCNYLESYRQVKRLLYLVLFLVFIVFASHDPPLRNAIWRPTCSKRLLYQHYGTAIHMYSIQIFNPCEF